MELIFRISLKTFLREKFFYRLFFKTYCQLAGGRSKFPQAVGALPLVSLRLVILQISHAVGESVKHFQIVKVVVFLFQEIVDYSAR